MVRKIFAWLLPYIFVESLTLSQSYDGTTRCKKNHLIKWIIVFSKIFKLALLGEGVGTSNFTTTTGHFFQNIESVFLVLIIFEDFWCSDAQWLTIFLIFFLGFWRSDFRSSDLFPLLTVFYGRDKKCYRLIILILRSLSTKEALNVSFKIQIFLCVTHFLS